MAYYLNPSMQQQGYEMNKPHNGYLCFCDWRRPYLQGQFENQKDVFRALGDLWQQQTDEQKEFWRKMAQGREAFPARLNPYILFSNIVRDDVMNYHALKTGEQLPITELGKRLGSMWKNLSPEERGFWENQAHRIWG